MSKVKDIRVENGVASATHFTGEGDHGPMNYISVATHPWQSHRDSEARLYHSDDDLSETFALTFNVSQGGWGTDQERESAALTIVMTPEQLNQLKVLLRKRPARGRSASVTLGSRVVKVAV